MSKLDELIDAVCDRADDYTWPLLVVEDARAELAAMRAENRSLIDVIERHKAGMTKAIATECGRMLEIEGLGVEVMSAIKRTNAELARLKSKVERADAVEQAEEATPCCQEVTFCEASHRRIADALAAYRSAP